jgi:hypothetical protein
MPEQEKNQVFVAIAICEPSLPDHVIAGCEAGGDGNFVVRRRVVNDVLAPRTRRGSVREVRVLVNLHPDVAGVALRERSQLIRTNDEARSRTLKLEQPDAPQDAR